MIQRKNKRIAIISIITVLIVTLIGTGIVWKVNLNKNQNQEIIEQLDFSSKRLVVTTNDNEKLSENYNAKSVSQSYSGS